LSGPRARFRKLNVLGVEAGQFSAGVRGTGIQRTVLVGVLMTGSRIESVSFSAVQVDGLDATDRLIDMVGRDHLRIDLIVSGSVCLAGFNLLNLPEISRKLSVPVIVAVSKRPRSVEVKAALRKHFSDWQRRLEIINSARPLRRILVKGKPVYIAVVGIEPREAGRIVKGLAVLGKIPEPVRCAGILARQLSGVIS